MSFAQQLAGDEFFSAVDDAVGGAYVFGADIYAFKDGVTPPDAVHGIDALQALKAVAFAGIGVEAEVFGQGCGAQEVLGSGAAGYRADAVAGGAKNAVGIGVKLGA